MGVLKYESRFFSPACGHCLNTRVVLEAPERIPERIFLGRGLAYVLRSP